ncbi:MAG: glucosaminidase domain-containing protein [Bacteroidales bacterium]|nr:glucosaminidase domain-containing protein [Bacteroidales bacterium]
MKRLLILLTAAVLLAAGAAIAAVDLETARKDYIDLYSALAISEMERTGVPASITLAQGLLESGAGRSTLATKANNHFGIKCGKAWKGEKTYHDDDAPQECFRSYSKALDSFKDHSDFLRYYDRYKSLFDLEITDYKGWCYGLKAAGYATDPEYATKLIKLIEDYDLTRFDKGTVVKVSSPDQLEKAVIMPANYDEQFHFSLERTIYQKNGVACIYSVAGDTFDSIALIYDLFPRELLRFNDLKEPVELLPGTIVYIQAKKNKAAKGLEKYIVGEDGESLREISQRFAVKMRSIEKRNKLKKGVALVKEQELLLR